MGSQGLSPAFLAHSASQKRPDPPPAACHALQPQPALPGRGPRLGLGWGGGVHLATGMKPTTEPNDFSPSNAHQPRTHKRHAHAPARAASLPLWSFCCFYCLLPAFRAPRGADPLCQGQQHPPAHGVPWPSCSGVLSLFPQPQNLSLP